jgi:hypothetical protein
MRFTTKQKALQWAREQNRVAPGHKAVKTTYFDLKAFDDVECWTVVLN